VSASSRLLRAEALEPAAGRHEEVGGGRAAALRLVLAETLHCAAPAAALSWPLQPSVVADGEAAL